MKQARFELKEETSRVLDVIKGQYGLKNRNDALNKLVELHRDEYLEPQFSDEEVKEYLAISKEYENKKTKSMTLDELDELLGLK